MIAVAKVPAKEARRRVAAPPSWHALRDAEGGGAGEVLCSFTCEDMGQSADSTGGGGDSAGGGDAGAAGAAGSRPVASAPPGQAALSIEFVAVRGMQAADGQYFAVARLEVSFAAASCTDFSPVFAPISPALIRIVVDVVAAAEQ